MTMIMIWIVWKWTVMMTLMTAMLLLSRPLRWPKRRKMPPWPSGCSKSCIKDKVALEEAQEEQVEESRERM